MKQIGALTFLLLVFSASHASPFIINDTSAPPPVENGLVLNSNDKEVIIGSVTPVIPENREANVKFGHHHLPESQKSFQPRHVSPVPEFHSSVIPPQLTGFIDTKPYVLKHNPSMGPNEEIPVLSAVPIVPSSQVPFVSERPVIPISEGQIPVEQGHHIPHKPKRRRLHLVPKHERKLVPYKPAVPHVPERHCECAIPIIPDDSKPQRRHHVPKHTLRTEKRPHVLHHDEDKL